MFLKVLKSKLHRARVTETRLHYPGSIGVDSSLMEAAGFLAYEAVWVVDVNNGNRLKTYIVPEEAGSGKVVVLGAAARLINSGDIVIIFSFGLYTPEEAEKAKPKVVVLGEKNEILEQTL